MQVPDGSSRGYACASRQDLLDATQLSVHREGNVVYVEVLLANTDENVRRSHGEYAYVDIGVALPTGVPVEVADSNGDAVFEDLAALRLEDSSGSIGCRDIDGRVTVPTDRDLPE